MINRNYTARISYENIADADITLNDFLQSWRDYTAGNATEEKPVGMVCSIIVCQNYVKMCFKSLDTKSLKALQDLFKELGIHEHDPASEWELGESEKE